MRAYDSVTTLGESSIDNIDELGDLAVKDSTEALTELGRYMVKKVAIEQAEQLAIYINQNPEMTTKDLQADARFSRIALHNTGDTRKYIPYTPIATTTAPIYARWHPAPPIVDLEMRQLKEKLPVWFEIMNSTVETDPSKTKFGIHCKDAEGYYMWEEEDGSMREKYMYVACVNATTADGEQYTVSAATYTDQFTAPVEKLEQEITQKTGMTVQSVSKALNSLKNEIVYLLMLVLVVVLVAGIFFARIITEPVKKLSHAGKQIADGNLDTEMPKIKSKDEISELGETMNLLVGAIKFLKKDKETKKKK